MPDGPLAVHSDGMLESVNDESNDVFLCLIVGFSAWPLLLPRSKDSTTQRARAKVFTGRYRQYGVRVR